MGAPVAPPVVELPLIISLDDHVIKPADLWTRPAAAEVRDREFGPRVEELPQGSAVLEGGRFRERPGTTERAVAYWR